MDVQASEFKNVAIVILNYNGVHHLERFLPDVVKNSPTSVRIIVADNASTDHSLQFLEKNYPQLERIVLSKNYGFAEGYNQALKQIVADFYVLLNSDVAPDKDWLPPLIGWLYQNNSHAAVQPKIKAAEERDKFEFAGGSGGFMDKWCYPFCRGRIFFDTEIDEGQYDDTREIFWASGAAMAIRADLYHTFNGLDGSYFAHMEEIDLCWRMKRAGFKIGVVPDSTVYHLGGGTLPQESPRKVFLNFRNSLKTIVKNEPISKLWWFLPFRLVLDGLAASFYIKQGRWSFFASVFKAHIAFYTSLPAIIKSRQSSNALVKANRIGPESKIGRYRGAIILDFFLLKKSAFSQLNQSN